jgi:hypothetical protein
MKTPYAYPFDGNPAHWWFLEKKNEIISPAWKAKVTEGLASPSDLHNTSKILSDEDAF